MVSSSFLWAVFALEATALPAPTVTFSSGAVQAAEKQIISEYFDMLGQKVQAGRKMSQAPVCNLNKAVQPVLSPTPLPGVTTGLTLKHVAIGRGTQNYTCGTNATAAPTAVGAVATLFNASCIASTYPDLLAMLPNVALQFDLNTAASSTANLSPADLMMSGHHFFTNSTTPFFDLDTANWELGRGGFSKTASLSAPSGASIGQNGKGYGAVAWLKLTARDGAVGLQEVYRLNTAGGSPPATCADNLNESFDVQYAAEYWFYSK